MLMATSFVREKFGQKKKLTQRGALSWEMAGRRPHHCWRGHWEWRNGEGGEIPGLLLSAFCPLASTSVTGALQKSVGKKH
jgi:hypothetical protein